MKKRLHKIQIAMNYKSLFLIVLLLAFPAAITFAQNNCKANITVLKNRNVKTITNSEYTFTLYLENSGSKAGEFTITANNANGSNENPDGSPTGSNIELTHQLLDTGMNPISNPVLVKAGETFSFLLKLSVPEGSPIEAWNCTEVSVEADNCVLAPGSILLYVFNPDPDNHE